MNLDQYNEKRDFRKTDEPKGDKKSSEGRLVFVVQKHDATQLHFDFRLEYDGVLLSWAVPKGPSNNTKDRRLAVRTEDHPYDYRNFEGAIPEEEYGGGTVMIWDEGEWEPFKDVEASLEKGELNFRLKGERMKGAYNLILMNKDDDNENWLLIKGDDEYKKQRNSLMRYDTSVRTERTMEEIAAEEG